MARKRTTRLAARAAARRPKGRAPARRGTRTAAAGAGPACPEHDDPAAVAALIASLDPAARATVGAVRRLILRSCAGCTEGVKWNSASFYRRGWFATVNARRRAAGAGGAVLVLHRGAAKLGPGAAAALKRSVADPSGLLAWRGADRATVEFRSASHVAELARGLGPVLASWAAGHTGEG
ncbi:MAG: DUF1801 domain-containing protein [Phycisphaerae bacterium]|nr:DUF1801 domain-containing protein [Phycisphaerae bacterium]